jgi:hypothetical protein
MSGVNPFDVSSVSRFNASIIILLNLNESKADVTLSFQHAAVE